ncbi:MAG: hypothetical protein J6Q85_03465 [Clostridia bacterium]|nr:hypothetical protein [Clostridia bacterium]
MYCEICGKWSEKYPLCKDCYYEEEYEGMDTETLECPICGAPTFIYYGNPRKDLLCSKHATMLKNGNLTKCTDCDKWLHNGEKCSCKKETQKAIVKQPPKEDSISDLTCIVCGENSNGKHFCYSCYSKYKDKVVLLKVHKCEFPTGDPLDESYEGVFECEDGHIVKSISEQVIDDWLYEQGIFHAYEAPLDIDEEKPLKPDFCLKNYLGKGKDVYIEYFGLKGQPKYDEQTAFKMKHYERLGITLICLYPKDSKNLKFALQTKVLNKDKIKENQINGKD